VPFLNPDSLSSEQEDCIQLVWVKRNKRQAKVLHVMQRYIVLYRESVLRRLRVEIWPHLLLSKSRRISLDIGRCEGADSHLIGPFLRICEASAELRSPAVFAWSEAQKL
jgi:hypothetical protein